MASRPVQISVDEKLLHAIDEDLVSRERGRSAFVREACEMLLKERRRAMVDESLVRAFSNRGAEIFDEVEDLVESQAWPDD